jgi:hypothetical protein
MLCATAYCLLYATKLLLLLSLLSRCLLLYTAVRYFEVNGISKFPTSEFFFKPEFSFVRTFFHEGEFFIILYGYEEWTGVSFMFFVWLRRSEAS